MSTTRGLSYFSWQLALFGALSQRKWAVFEENSSKTLFLAIFSYLVGQKLIEKSFLNSLQLIIAETNDK